MAARRVQRRPTRISGLPGSKARADAEVKKMAAENEARHASLDTSNMHPDDVQAAARSIAAKRAAARRLRRLP